MRGQVSTKGKLVLSRDKDSLAGGFRRDVTLGDLHSIENVTSTDFLKWKSLFIGAIDAKAQPRPDGRGNRPERLLRPHMIVTPEGRLNLAQIKETRRPHHRPPICRRKRRPGPPRPLPRRRRQNQAKSRRYASAKVTLQGGTVNFWISSSNPTARSTSPRSAARSAAVLGGGHPRRPRIARQLRQRRPGGGDGLNPLAAKTYLDLGAKSAASTSPRCPAHAGQYAGGTPSTKGKHLCVAYQSSTTASSAENRVFLDQLTFGDKGGRSRRHRPAGQARCGAPQRTAAANRYQPADFRVPSTTPNFPSAGSSSGHRSI